MKHLEDSSTEIVNELITSCENQAKKIRFHCEALAEATNGLPSSNKIMWANFLRVRAAIDILKGCGIESTALKNLWFYSGRK